MSGRDLCCEPPHPAGHLRIDTMHTKLAFSVTHLGISIIRGTFDRFSGWLAVGEGPPSGAVSRC